MLRRALLSSLAAAAPGRRYRVGVIGHTGRGNYGHGLDAVWRSLDSCELVAVADADEKGRPAAVARLGGPKAYADYREMLVKEKPDIVAIGPRWMDQRVAMVTAAADAGAHVYMEKPFAMTLDDADRMVHAVRQRGVKLQIAHQMRLSPYALRAREMIQAGEIGEVEEIRTRGKEDHRAGGEDMMVLGSHLFDLMRFFLGDPRHVSASVTVEGREIGAADVREATEPLGLIAGRQISAVFSFADAVPGHFASRQVADTHGLRFGMWIHGSRGVLFLPFGIYPDGGLSILRSRAWWPESGQRWEKIPCEAPEPYRGRPQVANALMAADLLRAIESNGRPCCNEEDGRWTIEMAHGVYASALRGARVALPLPERGHPLARLRG